MNMDDDYNEFDDFFNEFGSDGIDPEKYKEYLMEIYKELTGQDISDINDEFESLDNGKYIQDLSNEDHQIIFDTFVNDKDMDLTIHIEKSETDGIRMVEEIWDSEEYGINLKRAYQYNYKSISKLNEKIQIKIYETILPDLVENEEFEEAAKVRDLLKDLVDK